MQCFICGEQMRVVMVEPHVIDMPGFELRTFQCVGCGDVEKRPFFDSERALGVALVPEAEAAADPSPSSPSEPAEAPSPPGGRMKSMFGGFAKLRGKQPDQ